jgi:hypothetical protein
MPSLIEQVEARLCHGTSCERRALHICDEGDCLNKFCNEHGGRCPNCRQWLCGEHEESHAVTCAPPDHVANYPSEAERFGRA